MYKRILVPVDGSEPSNRALAAALRLARESQGRVRLLHAFDPMVYLTGFEVTGDVLEAARSQAQQVLDEAQRKCETAQVPVDTRFADVPGRRLGDIAAEEARIWDADLVVVGSHGRCGIDRLLLGSGAEQIIRLAPIPALVIR